MKSRRIKQVPVCCPSNLITVKKKQLRYLGYYPLLVPHLVLSHLVSPGIHLSFHPVTWISDQLLESPEGLFQYSSSCQAEGQRVLVHNPIPPLPSCSKAQATPNVSDVSLAIVHGWATLNGQLVHRPAPYNGPLFPYNLFSAFPSFMKRNLSLSPILSFCSFAPSLGFGI